MITAQTYLDLFRDFGITGEDFYLHTEDEDAIFRLFDQMTDLLVQPSPFNDRMPEPFIRAAKGYNESKRAWVLKFDDPDNRLFMLSDLYDFVKFSAIHFKETP